MATADDVTADREPDLPTVAAGHARGGPGASGVFSGPIPALGEVVWDLPLAPPTTREVAGGFWFHATLVDPDLLLLSTPTTLRGLEADTGRILWVRDGDGDRQLLVVGDLAVVASGEQIAAVASRTGRREWTYEWSQGWIGAAGPAAIIAIRSGEIAAIDPVSGTERWHVPTRPGPLTVVLDGEIVLYRAGSWLTARDVSSGRQLWATTIPETSSWHELSSDDGFTVHWGDTADGPEVTVLDTRTGLVLWSMPIEGGYPAFVLAGHLVLWRPDVVTGISLEDGATSWELRLTEPVDLRPDREGGDEFYVLSNQRRMVTAIDARTGGQRWVASDLPIRDVGEIISVTSDRVLVRRWPDLIALPSGSGPPLWQVSVSPDPPCEAVVAGGVVYVPSGRGLVAADAETGAVRWEYGPFARDDIDVEHVATDGDLMALFTTPHRPPLRSTLHIADATAVPIGPTLLARQTL